VHGIGVFSPLYMALENTSSTPDPQLRVFQTVSGGSGSTAATINAYSSASGAYKHHLYLKTSGEMWLWPTIGDAIRVVSASFQPYNDNTGSLGAASKRWAGAFFSAPVQAGVVAFSSLGAVPSAGTFTYCSDCTTASPCAGSGNGHMAVSNGTNWECD